MASSWAWLHAAQAAISQEFSETKMSAHLATYFDTDRTDTPPGLSTGCCSATQHQ